MDQKPAKKRGPPRYDIKPVMNEMKRRLETGVAKPLFSDEVVALYNWTKANHLFPINGGWLTIETFKNRIARRTKGAKGYKLTHEWHLANLLAKSRTTE